MRILDWRGGAEWCKIERQSLMGNKTGMLFVKQKEKGR